jgi:hypothetical protein
MMILVVMWRAFDKSGKIKYRIVNKNGRDQKVGQEDGCSFLKLILNRLANFARIVTKLKVQLMMHSGIFSVLFWQVSVVLRIAVELNLVYFIRLDGNMLDFKKNTFYALC